MATYASHARPDNGSSLTGQLRLEFTGRVAGPQRAARLVLVSVRAAAATGPEMPIEDAITLALELVNEGPVANPTAARYSGLWVTFRRYAAQVGANEVHQLTPELVAGWLRTRTRRGLAPSAATRNFRRTALRHLFAVLRSVGVTQVDPTVDLVLPSRGTLEARGFTPGEIEQIRFASLSTMWETRLPAIVALAEAGAGSAEIGKVRPADLDGSSRVWLRGHTKTDARWAALSGWGALQVQRRLRVQPSEGELDDHTWEFFRAAARLRYPSEPDMWGADEPINRLNYHYFQRTHLDSGPLLDDAKLRFEEHAARGALKLGLCDSEGGGSWTHPSPDRVVGADGKVIKARRIRRKHKVTGKVLNPGDRDSGMYHVGGQEKPIRGLGYVIAVTRGDEPNRRMVLGVEHAPRKGGEMLHATTLLDRVLANLPGTQVLVYDGAARGTHNEHFQTRHGVITISRLHNSRGDRVVERPYGEVTFTEKDGSDLTRNLHLRDGRPHLVELDEAGDMVLVPLVRKKVHRRPRLNRYCWYVTWALPDELGGATVMLRHDQNPADDERKLNTAEHLRIIPPDDDDHAKLYGRRNDTESGHRIIDDSLWRERAPHLGARRTWWHLIWHAAYRNAQALALARRAHLEAAA